MTTRPFKKRCPVCDMGYMQDWDQSKYWPTDYRHICCGATVKKCAYCHKFAAAFITCQSVHSDRTACWYWVCMKCGQRENEMRNLRND